MESYEILSINALRLFESIDISNLNKHTCLIDLTDPATIGPDSIAEEETRKDNALFFQIEQYNEKKETDFLKKNLVFIDFSEVFSELSDIEPADIITSLKNKKPQNDLVKFLGYILNPSNTIKIKFKDKVIGEFSAFDKSANMSKNSRITYINENIRKKIDERLRLGINFDDFEMVLSKYYAYRGLYLTTAERIEQTKKLKFDQTTVIVIPDNKFNTDNPYLPEGTPTEIALIESPKKEDSLNDKQIHTFISRERVYEGVNAFDGEGIISPEYSKYLNKALKNGEAATTYQIRMPFIKGLLFECDFHKFIKEDSYIVSPNPKIIDMFGKERDLNKVQIILTESMFKCGKWIKDNWESIKEKTGVKTNDQMKFFFDQFNKYNHSLYICGTNLSLQSTGIERLNYQFLSTLKMSQNDFNKLIEDHFNYGEELLKETFRPKELIENPKTISEVLVNAATKNPLFYNEPRLIDQAYSQLKNIAVECGMGRLLTTGENRYISGDLLYFLLHVASLAGKVSERTDPSTWKPHTTLNNNFYMPNPNIPLSKDKYMAILRCPHLSRNEEIMLKPYLPKEGEVDLYEKYFSHLHGILMLPTTPLVALALGSADFDGDMIFVYSNDLIIKAIQDGGYQDGIKVLPVINIPDEPSETKKPSDPEFVYLIINTFTNKVGLLSNYALLFASKEYCYSRETSPDAEEKNPEDSLCAQAGFVVNLDIDACKRGKHPVSDINELKKKVQAVTNGRTKNEGQYFIDCKKVLKTLSSKEIRYKITYDKNIPGYKVTTYKSGNANLEIKAPGSNMYNLSLLPHAFADKEYQTYSNKQYLFDAEILGTVPKKGIRFKFEKDDTDYVSKLDPDILTNVKSLVKAYIDLTIDIKKYEEHCKLNRTMSSVSDRKMQTLLKLKYDNPETYCLYTDKEDDSSITVDEAYRECIEKIVFNNKISVENSVSNLIAFKWQYTEKKAREETLYSILELQKDDLSTEELLSPAALSLLCDFANDGYMLLYHLLISKRSIINARESFETFFGPNHLKSRNDSFGYYNMFRKCYSETLPLKEDTDDDGNSENNEEPSTFEKRDPKWKDAVKASAKMQLLIITNESKSKKIKENYTEAVKYAYAARSEVDSRGTFFWDVLEPEWIFDNIQEKGGK